MKQAMEDAGLSTNIAVTDSKMNLRLVADDDGNDDTFNPGHLTMYPLKKDFNNESTWDYPWILEEQGPTAGVDYYSTVFSQFQKMNKKTRNGPMATDYHNHNGPIYLHFHQLRQTGSRFHFPIRH